MKYNPQDGLPYYLALVKLADLRSNFSSGTNFIFLGEIEEELAVYRYAPDKWNIRQIVGHLADHERIMMYRAFLLSRNKQIELWGYDQLSLVENSRFEELPLRQLVADFQNVRKASIGFIDGLSERLLERKGTAGPYEVTMEDYLKSIIGHEEHHIRIIKERYL